MRLELDSVLCDMQPTSLNWSQPRLLGYDGAGAPVYGLYRTCSLAFERMSVVMFQRWWDASQDGLTHTVSLPHPESGILTTYTLYVSEFAPRMNTRDLCEAAAAGVDILLTRIAVT